MEDAPLELPAPDLGPAGAEYERWLRETPDAGEEYLLTEARVRFDARPDDVLAAPPGLVTAPAPGGSLVHGGPLPRALVVAGVAPDRLARFLGALDGSSTLAAARAEAGLDEHETRAVLGATFGLAVFAPHAVTALERRVSGCELVRFPGAPYEIVRNYWSNMADVREALAPLLASLGNPRQACSELARLHVLSLVGAGGRSFYRPASRVTRRGLTPGALWQTPAETVETPLGTRFVAGPRVHAPLLGGAGYAALLAELTGDPEATLGRREHRDAGLAWGRIVTASAEGDPKPEPWFCPPRPITLAHARSLCEALARAVGGAAGGPSEQQAALDGLADFHQRFVRLHPYRACNQALAMNIVNAVLARVAGAGMPHLVLDHVALRFAPTAYRRLFRLAARQWCVEGAPAPRLGHLMRKKGAYFSLVAELAKTADADAAAVLARSSPEAARLALLELP
jgi:hypothetical protein